VVEKKDLLDELVEIAEAKSVDIEMISAETEEGQQLLNLCSNNYLGLSSHPQVKEAAVQAIQQWGCGSGASRLICGNFSLHEALEGRLAHFKGTEEQKDKLTAWFDEWGKKLAKENKERTGYDTDGLLDVHIITDEDIKRKSSWAAHITSPYQTVRKLNLKKES
jgi:hypothetical protein